jgi:hypothetical protein
MVQRVESWTGRVKCINDVDRREGVGICITLAWFVGLIVAFNTPLAAFLGLFFSFISLTSNRFCVENGLNGRPPFLLAKSRSHPWIHSDPPLSSTSVLFPEFRGSASSGLFLVFIRH